MAPKFKKVSFFENTLHTDLFLFTDNFKQEIKQPGWNNLSLSYTVPWPLHLILSPKVLSKYNEVFRFLLLAKRTQILLHEAWAEQKKDKFKIRYTDSWQLRTHMAFVVDNLQYYLMADVLESHFSQLLERLDQSTNFEELRHSHDIFLASIVSNTFVNNKQVNQCLTELLQSCLQYGRMVQIQGKFLISCLFTFY